MATDLRASALLIFCHTDMFDWLYRLPLSYVVIGAVMAILLWSMAYYRFAGRGYGINASMIVKWKTFNYIFLALTVFIILKFTVFSREAYIDVLELIPFKSFDVAKVQPEMYRSLTMNIALFVPYGLFFSCGLSEKLPYFARILCTSLSGCLCSLIIEATQYLCKLGEAWTDDVLCNVLGAFLGSLSIVVWKLYFFKKKNFTF